MTEPTSKTFQLPAKKFYIADCEVVEFSFEQRNQRFESAAAGVATLVSGDIELQFNWVAEGGVTAQNAYDFNVSLDDEDPGFDLLGVDGLSVEETEQACLSILASCNWKTEVAECLPKNETELAAM